MAKKKHISAVITLKDNFSAGLRGVRREQKSFQKEVAQTRKAMDSINKKKMKARLDATQAHKTIQSLRKQMAPLRKKVVSAIILKDKASQTIKKVKAGLKQVAKIVVKPIMIPQNMAGKIINKTMSGLSKLKSAGSFVLKATGLPSVLGAISKVGKALKGVAKLASIPLAIAGAGAGMAMKEGMMLEQQQVSMKHFMGVGNKGKKDSEIQSMTNSYLKDLRNNANATPFETGEVIQAGTRALQIAGGNTKEAMSMVKLAEDMAALNPGKTVGDAMEALADMNVGEMERLKEFGLKASSKDDPKEVQKKLQNLYKGGSGKLADTGQGKLSTITGKLKSNMADMGLEMINAMKPALDGIIGFIDQITPKMSAFGKQVGQTIGGVISFITENFPAIKATIEPIITGIGTAISAAMPVIGQAFNALKPIFAGLATFVGAVMQNVATAVQVAVPIVSNLIKNLSPVFKAVGDTLSALGVIFKNVFSAISSVVKKAYDFIKPLIDGIGGMISTVSNGVSAVANAITGKGKKKKNATGTKYFSGGISLVGEHGPELVQMPNGSKVYTNTETNSILNQQPKNKTSKSSSSNSIYLTISKLADQIIVREEADIDKLTDKVTSNLVKKINQNVVVFGG